MIVKTSARGGKIVSGRGKGKRFTWKGEARKILKSQLTLVPVISLRIRMAEKELGV